MSRTAKTDGDAIITNAKIGNLQVGTNNLAYNAVSSTDGVAFSGSVSAQSTALGHKLLGQASISTAGTNSKVLLLKDFDTRPRTSTGIVAGDGTPRTTTVTFTYYVHNDTLGYYLTSSIDTGVASQPNGTVITYSLLCDATVSSTGGGTTYTGTDNVVVSLGVIAIHR